MGKLKHLFRLAAISFPIEDNYYYAKQLLGFAKAISTTYSYPFARCDEILSLLSISW